ncbi:Urease accessory protein UreE [Helicobacter heilmannii]|uniref:urease accessory protein UreE n=1 Tax=Helicobacter TaxID=209 RepID=UPI0006A1613B|nr:MULTISPECIES: urease accessory protein UreE [Helicobacter]BEG57407.1 Urease accessory protein UreE [Helicobacter sp. NHP21005]CRF49199.1 Urease accessory protein UreE [Helicobacter heilmannii]
MHAVAILGNLHITAPNGAVDYIDLEWFDSQKRMGRFKTRGGQEVVMKLENPPKVGLADGDILIQTPDTTIAINILPTQVLYAYASNMHEVARICYEVGNRHASLYYGEENLSFKTPFEKPLQVLFERLGVEHAVLKSKLDASKRISVSAPHADPLEIGTFRPLKFTDSQDLQIVIKK